MNKQQDQNEIKSNEIDLPNARIVASQSSKEVHLYMYVYMYGLFFGLPEESNTQLESIDTINNSKEPLDELASNLTRL